MTRRGTMLDVPGTGLSSAAEAAAIDAAKVAASSGLTMRDITEPAEHRRAEQLIDRIWATQEGRGPMLPGEVMRMLAFSGSYVAGAYRGDELAGVAVAVLGEHLPGHGPTHLHSHVAGVAPEAQGGDVGFALKLHQRAWALARDIGVVTWTFDPLVARNGYFNLSKLAAHATRYLVDFYGDMADGINAGQGSDRLLVEWHLDAPAVAAAAQGTPAVVDDAVLSADRTLLDHQLNASTPAEDGPLICAVPADIEGLRRSDPKQALAWRRGVRQALSGALDRGYRITGFARSGWYVLERRLGGSE
jgi:predicted GNAT superfamily acetyltransferase